MQSGDVYAVPLGLRVLVVEDDAASRDAICRGLAAHGGVMLEAVDGVGALQQAAVGKPDVIVLDLMLPMLDGEHVIYRLRQTSDVPIVVVSAKRSEVDRVRALDLGADDYLVKPFAPAELLARVHALLRRSAAAGREQPLAYADLTLDPATRETRRGDRVFELTPTEFALLHYLMRHPRQVLQRA